MTELMDWSWKMLDLYKEKMAAEVALKSSSSLATCDASAAMRKDLIIVSWEAKDRSFVSPLEAILTQLHFCLPFYILAKSAAKLYDGAVMWC